MWTPRRERRFVAASNPVAPAAGRPTPSKPRARCALAISLVSPRSVASARRVAASSCAAPLSRRSSIARSRAATSGGSAVMAASSMAHAAATRSLRAAATSEPLAARAAAPAIAKRQRHPAGAHDPARVAHDSRIRDGPLGQFPGRRGVLTGQDSRELRRCLRARLNPGVADALAEYALVGGPGQREVAPRQIHVSATRQRVVEEPAPRHVTTARWTLRSPPAPPPSAPDPEARGPDRCRRTTTRGAPRLAHQPRRSGHDREGRRDSPPPPARSVPVRRARAARWSAVERSVRPRENDRPQHGRRPMRLR